MTDLTKPVRRKAGKYVVTMAPEGLYIRRAGKRFTYGPLNYEHLELTLAKLYAEQTRPRRKPRRRGILTY